MLVTVFLLLLRRQCDQGLQRQRNSEGSYCELEYKYCKQRCPCLLRYQQCNLSENLTSLQVSVRHNMLLCIDADWAEKREWRQKALGHQGYAGEGSGSEFFLGAHGVATLPFQNQVEVLGLPQLRLVVLLVELEGGIQVRLRWQRFIQPHTRLRDTWHAPWLVPPHVLATGYREGAPVNSRPLRPNRLSMQDSFKLSNFNFTRMLML